MLRSREFPVVTRSDAKADNHAVLYTHPPTTPPPRSATRSRGEHYTHGKAIGSDDIPRVCSRAHLGLDPRLLHTPPVRDELGLGRRQESREVNVGTYISQNPGVSFRRRGLQAMLGLQELLGCKPMGRCTCAAAREAG
jgi:hypothetical protein